MKLSYSFMPIRVYRFWLFFSKSRWLVIKSGTCMKKQRVQSFSKIGGAFEIPPGGEGAGVKIQILEKKGNF